MWGLIGSGLMIASVVGFVWSAHMDGMVGYYVSVASFEIGVALLVGSVLYALARAISH